jgi:hypothetical protein
MKRARHTKEGASSPVRYLDASEQLGKYTLVWLFWPFMLVTIGIWWGLNSWLLMPDWSAWVFLGAAAVVYVVIGLLGMQLVLFASRLLGRQSNLR